MPNGHIGHKLMPATYVDLTLESLRKDHPNFSAATLKRMLKAMEREKLYRNDLYQVAINKDPPHGFAGLVVWELSIKRTDKEPILDWRDIQTIKNQLCGEEAEMFQLFPAESRLVDTANQYYFFALMKGPTGRFPRLPVGWTVRTVSEDTPGMGKQRPFEKEAP